jgi:hypothetical protein
MKKIILICSMAMSLNGFSQLNVVPVEKAIEIGKIAPMGMFIISMEKTKDTYTVTYRDYKFIQITEIKSFSFKDENNAFEDLYAMIIKGFDTMPEEDTMLELGGKHVWLHYEKSMGFPVFRFAHAVDANANVIGFSQLLSKKQVIKLFSKKA